MQDGAPPHFSCFVTWRFKWEIPRCLDWKGWNKLLMMDILMSETCWAHKKWNKIASDIKLVLYSSIFSVYNVRGQGILSMSSKKDSSPIDNARYIFLFFRRLVEEPRLGFRFYRHHFRVHPSVLLPPCLCILTYFVIMLSHRRGMSVLSPKCRHFISYSTVWVWPNGLCVLLKVKGQVVTICTTWFNVELFYVLPTLCIYVLYINLRTNSGSRCVQCKLLFVTALESIYSAVRTGSLYRKDSIAPLKG